jgi:hypothetical protein
LPPASRTNSGAALQPGCPGDDDLDACRQLGDDLVGDTLHAHCVSDELDGGKDL